MIFVKNPLRTNYDDIIRFKNYEKGKKYYLHLSFDKPLVEKFAKLGGLSVVEAIFKKMPDWFRTPQYIPMFGTFKMISIETSNKDKDIEFVFEKQ